LPTTVSCRERPRGAERPGPFALPRVVSPRGVRRRRGGGGRQPARALTSALPMVAHDPASVVGRRAASPCTARGV